MWIPYDISGSLKAASAPETIRQSRADLTPRAFLLGFLLAFAGVILALRAVALIFTRPR